MISVELWRARIGAFNSKHYSGFLSSLFSSYSPFKFHRRRKRYAAQEPPPDTSEETELLLTVVTSDSRNTAPFPVNKRGAIVNSIKNFLLFFTFFWSSFSSRFLPTSGSFLCSLLRSTRLNRCLLREAIVRLVLLIMVIISQSLIISGDIETNPGPVTGESLVIESTCHVSVVWLHPFLDYSNQNFLCWYMIDRYAKLFFTNMQIKCDIIKFLRQQWKISYFQSCCANKCCWSIKVTACSCMF